ncbi:serine hydrolase domain-containing protein [Chitinophaga dinghuensis]|nr:serine hydrolase domain-containing protein [Chitinophaga dinghuensis]
MDKIVKDLEVPGMAVALVGADGILWSKAKGLADMEKKEPVTEKTVFKIGSIAKTMVGFSVLKLQEAGKLNIDADINDYLPFKVVNPHHPGKKITLKHLLTHTSGIQDTIYNRDLLTAGFLTMEQDNPMILRDYIKGILTPGGQYYNPITFMDDSKGAIYSYSNIGAALAACIVEQVAGENFDTYSYKSFITPLNTRTLVWHLRDFTAQPFAMPYYVTNKLTPTGKYSTVDYCSGGLHSNLTDLATFARMLINNGMASGKQLISPQSLDAMKKVPFPDVKPSQGLFLEHFKLGTSDIYGHSGDVIGGSSLLYFCPDTKRAVVIILNRKIEEDDLHIAVNQLLGDLFRL